MYVRIYNKHRLDDIMVVEELSDFLFEEGWRFLEYVGHGAINIFDQDEIRRQLSIRQWGF
jgi:hypothetical protein